MDARRRRRRLRFIERAATAKAPVPMDILILFHFGRAFRCSPANLILTLESIDEFNEICYIYGPIKRSIKG